MRVDIKVGLALDLIVGLDVGLTVGFSFVGDDDTTSEVGIFELLGDLVLGYIEEGDLVEAILGLIVRTPSVA